MQFSSHCFTFRNKKKDKKINKIKKNISKL